MGFSLISGAIGFLFFAFCVYISSRYRTFNKTFDDYVAAGRSLGLRSSVSSIVSTWFGAGVMAGVATEVYRGGIGSVLYDPFGVSLSLFVVAWFLVPRFRNKSYLTISDALEAKFGRNFAVIMSILMVPVFVGTLAAQFVAFAGVLDHLYGAPRALSAIGGAIVSVAFVHRGGLRGIVISDVIQLGLIVFSIAVAVFFFLGLAADSANRMASLISHDSMEILTQAGSGQGLRIAGQLLLPMIGAGLSQDIFQRVIAAKDNQTARNSLLISAPIYLLLCTGPILMGILARDIFPSLENADTVLLSSIRELCPPVVHFLFCMGLVAAIFTTADGYLLAGSTLLTRNVLRYLAKDPQKSQLVIVKGASIVLAIMALLIGTLFPRVFGLMVFCFMPMITGSAVPMFAALFMEKPSKFAGWSSSVAGILTWLIGFCYLIQNGSDQDSAQYTAGIVGVMVSFVVFTVLTFFILN